MAKNCRFQQTLPEPRPFLALPELLPELRRRWSVLCALLGGLLYPLGFAPYGWFWLHPVALALLLLSLSGRAPGQAAAHGFVFGCAAFLTGIYWITISVHTFGGAPLILALFLMLALVAFMAGYVAVLGYALARLCPEENAMRWFLAFPAVWMLLEWVRGWLLSGFGWLSPGYAHTDSALLGYLPVLGVLGTGWISALSGAALMAVLRRPDLKTALYTGGVVALWLGGALLGSVNWTRDDGSQLSASLVQGAVPQEQKWLPESLQPTIKLYVELTAEHLNSDLIIWPEAAIPRYKHHLTGLWEELERIGRETDTDFLVGTIEFDAGSNERFNTVSAFGSSQDTYRKRHLVPFGEYFPVPQFVKEHMRVMNLPYQNFSAGPDGQPLLTIAGQKISVSICYEDVFGAEMLDSVRGSTLLVNVSNDAWFGGSLAPHQHLQIARTRAAEVGRYMLRSTNNGISAIIDRRGNVLQRSPQFEPAVLAAVVPGTSGTTPYMRWGDWPMIGLSLLAVALCVIRRR